MRESSIEKHLRLRAEARGGLALKFTSPGRRHVSDRLVILPGGGVWFVELKAPGKSLRPGQARFRAALEKLGCNYKVIDSKAEVDDWLKGKELWRKIL